MTGDDWPETWARIDSEAKRLALILAVLFVVVATGAGLFVFLDRLARCVG